MDYTQEYFQKTKAKFLETIKPECQDKEDATVCIEKHSKAFEVVFNALKDQLDKEDKIPKILEERHYTNQTNPKIIDRL